MSAPEATDWSLGCSLIFGGSADKIKVISLNVHKIARLVKQECCSYRFKHLASSSTSSFNLCMCITE